MARHGLRVVVGALVVFSVGLHYRFALAEPVLLASAEMGAAGRDSGTSITTAQFVGWRFSIDEPLRVERVGGHIHSDPFQEGEIFAAIVQLDALDAVPHGAPFTEEEVVAHTTFRANFPSDEYLTPLSATLAAGNYRLVVKVVDPTGYREPLPLALEGRRADGSYTLDDDFEVTVCASCQ